MGILSRCGDRAHGLPGGEFGVDCDPVYGSLSCPRPNFSGAKLTGNKPQYLIKRRESPLPEGDGLPAVYHEVWLCDDGVPPHRNCDEWFETEQKARAWIIGRGGEVLE